MTGRRARELVRLLQEVPEGRPAQDLVDALGISERTVQREVDALRREGYGIEGLRGPGGGYRLVRAQEPVPVEMDVQYLAALRRAAVDALLWPQDVGSGPAGAPVRPDLLLEAVQQLDRWQPAEVVRHSGGGVALPGQFLALGANAGPRRRRMVMEALLAILQSGHRARFGVAQDVFEPHRLVCVEGRWLVVLWRLASGWVARDVDDLDMVIEVHDTRRSRPGMDEFVAGLVSRGVRGGP